MFGWKQLEDNQVIIADSPPYNPPLFLGLHHPRDGRNNIFFSSVSTSNFADGSEKIKQKNMPSKQMESWERLGLQSEVCKEHKEILQQSLGYLREEPREGGFCNKDGAAETSRLLIKMNCRQGFKERCTHSCL